MHETDQTLNDAEERNPQQLGPYRIVRVLGEGGMGIVYEAVESGAVRRRVALKVVRAGLRSAEVKARFEAERQALALMDHPGIATVYQAGETPDGEPYFAMELVKGLPIDEFCDVRKLSVEERLQLFIAVCEAVQHAHQKGVIHRDLKPSNVLVTEQDGRPQPKIIDFGIAKALGLHLTEKTYVTQAGVPLGTAAYMSPEQAESSGIDVDTRSDIYSLGVILYQLLVGRIPVEPSDYGINAFMYRLGAGDTQTPRPSIRFDSLGEYREAVAEARKSDAEHLRRELSGDIDWIVMKALEPNRGRRYETATAFVADIDHYLRHEAVSARPPTASYRLRKFVRRNRVPVLAATLAVLALVLSTIFAAAGMVRATRAEKVAANEAEASRRVSAFLVDLFRVAMPSEAGANAITARELLDRGAERVRTDLSLRPEIQGRMMYTIGTAYSSLGLYDAARKQLEMALGVRTKALGPNDPAVAQTELALGKALASHGDTKQAEQHYEQALTIEKRHAKAADTATATILAAMAGLRVKQGKNREADSLYRRALAIDEPVNKASLSVARDLAGLGIVAYYEKRYADAEPLMLRSLDIRQRLLEPGHTEIASLLSNLGGLYWAQDRFAEALPVLERTRAIYEHTLDPMHPYMASLLTNLAETYWKLGRYKEAEPLFKRALAIKEARLNAGDPSIAATLHSYAGMLNDAGRRSEAAAAYSRALSIRERALAPDNEELKATVEEYAKVLREMGRSPEADALLARHNIPQ